MSLMDANPVNPKSPKRVAIVPAKPAVSPTTGWPVSLWWSEPTHRYYLFTERGYEVELFSYDGGACVADGMSAPNDASGFPASDLISQGFIHAPKRRTRVDDTAPAAALDAAKFDAIRVAGGQATRERTTAPHPRFVEFHTAGNVAAALCRGSAVLRHARLPNGELLARKRTVDGFAKVEENFADNAVWPYGLLPRDKHVRPWRIEHELRAAGANYVQAGLWRSFAVGDGNLAIGQRSFSGAATAEPIVRALGD